MRLAAQKRKVEVAQHNISASLSQGSSTAFFTLSKATSTFAFILSILSSTLPFIWSTFASGSCCLILRKIVPMSEICSIMLRTQKNAWNNEKVSDILKLNTRERFQPNAKVKLLVNIVQQIIAKMLNMVIPMK